MHQVLVQMQVQARRTMMKSSQPSQPDRVE
jgi:hypothetical protein